MKLWKILSELLFPARCPVCDGVQPFGERICPACAEKLVPIRAPYCCKCGKVLADERAEYCRDCQEHVHGYIRGRALYEYPSVRQSLYRFKYKGRREYAEAYGELLAEHMKEEIALWKPDALVPVPLHRSRQRKRGYNQAQELAFVLGKRLDILVDTKIIRRNRKTVPQKQLNRQMRQNNLKKAFKIARNDVKLSTIIIIDDIYTTGSTIDSMAAVLRDAGVERIYFLTLAIGRE